MKKTTNEKGITIVTLVITIIILIILATISINAVMGENGLIQVAKDSKDSAENAIETETGKVNGLMQEYANIMAEDAEITDPGGSGGNIPGGDEEPEEPKPGDPIDGTLAVGPQVSDGMIPVKYVNGTGWVKTTSIDSEWYNYGEKKWANIVLGDATFNTSGSYEVLDETKTYSMLVWIPRYAYKITSMYHQSGSSGGNIEIVFLNTSNITSNGENYNSKTEYPSVTTGGGMSDYVVHPAFTFGENEIAGFWVGKFETSNNGGKIQIKAGVSSWRDIYISTIHETCIGMNNSGNGYGLSDSDSIVDPHMMKNTEWGAVAYLAQSIYGKNSELEINESSSFYTGGGSGTSYKTVQGQSTTGNITGIYDMSGGAYEYVAGYLNSTDVPYYEKSLFNAPLKYKDVYLGYQIPTSDGIYGDAVWETSSSSSSSKNSWYGNYSYFPYSGWPFFLRGGYYDNSSNAGIFSFEFFDEFESGDSGRSSFRVVIPVF